MFRDTEKALQRLEEELLEDEEYEDDECEEDDDGEYVDDQELMDALGVRPSPGCVYNTDRTDEDLEELSQEVLTPRNSGRTGLLIAALLLSAAILATISWWILHVRGLI